MVASGKLTFTFLKHLGSSNICDISLHTEFQLPGLSGSNVPGVGVLVAGWVAYSLSKSELAQDSKRYPEIA